MSAIFVHVSDIHFGQERDDSIHIHNDVKAQLIEDAAEVVAGLPGGAAQGILVTGDIAQSGTWEQYEVASRWLDELAERIKCPIHRVQMVPGNHDLDRKKLSTGGAKLLEYIRVGGPAEYEKVFSNPYDRATLLARFEDYDRFSFGYRCALDEEAKFASNLRIEIGPGRWIRFVRLNSSLLCTGDEREDNPELIIGSRQFTIPKKQGEENIVLVHHPLHWYKDSADVQQYIRARARVLITGHEHDPKVDVDAVVEGTDVLMLAAGAAVPYRSNDIYTYTYNIIEFDWDEQKDALVVTIHPRAWNPLETCFEADGERLGGRKPRFTLGSPNFRKCGKTATAVEHTTDGHAGPLAEPLVDEVPAETAETREGEMSPIQPTVEGYELALLRFFRDLVESERLRILVELDAIPSDLDERMTQGVERMLFDWLVSEGRLREVVMQIDKMILERKEGNA
ncbi:metallophosphoesterase [Burkholderia multivorans]|uniref:metallophosphoesterase n=1 Tax=Burkholderia multivorans TaxID=87883 RepID=UPI001C24F5B0|nr:metallophosphoesterase [Burkholderia multivorans]MBU9371583.1 metallophosphoesterase [Burkholderia multivorans]MBU9412846.1 metallophosphoesterase [Burkholderia multivorans]UXZ82816.1 metallophosphoesterase [Burkholderia multivorans]